MSHLLRYYESKKNKDNIENDNSMSRYTFKKAI